MALGYVRPARAEEAGQIARIQLTTWRVAYRRLLPRRVLDRIDEAWLTERWRESIESPPSPAHRVLVAIEQAEQGQAPTAPDAQGPDAQGVPDLPSRPGTAYLVGFLAAGPADTTALAPGEPAESLRRDLAAVTDLLVEPRWGRRGHGSRLLAAGTDGWRADRMHTAVAWAYEGDRATVSFLRSAGWEPDGARRSLDVDDLLVPQLRLHVSV